MSDLRTDESEFGSEVWFVSKLLEQATVAASPLASGRDAHPSCPFSAIFIFENKNYVNFILAEQNKQLINNITYKNAPERRV